MIIETKLNLGETAHFYINNYDNVKVGAVEKITTETTMYDSSTLYHMRIDDKLYVIHSKNLLNDYEIKNLPMLREVMHG